MSSHGRRQRVAAYALLVQDGCLLLRRLAHINHAAGSLTLPRGGLELGRHPQTAVIREVFEETGLRIALKGIAGIDSEVLRLKEGPLHALRIIYNAGIISGSLAYEENGSTDMCRWLSHAECLDTPLVPVAER